MNECCPVPTNLTVCTLLHKNLKKLYFGCRPLKETVYWVSQRSSPLKLFAIFLEMHR